MKILLSGKNGQVGWELQQALAPLGALHAFNSSGLDLRDLPRLREVVRDLKPDLIVNAAAYTAVDLAESDIETAQTVNGAAPGVLAEEADLVGAALIHFSTDYVFDGRKRSPYTESDLPNPLSVYGSSKLAGEQAIQETGGSYLIFRTSWVYSLRRESFVTKVLEWARKHETLRIVADQTAGPTWCRTLAETVARLLREAGEGAPAWIGERSGLYHLAAEGYSSRFEWAEAILRYDPRPEEQVVKQVLQASSDEFPTPAERPAFSALDCGLFDRTFRIPRPGWEESLRSALGGIW
jgi:dTDP-4-dehydrorhamnose reductase